MKAIAALVLGLLFGILLVKSEVSSWDRIHKMFLFEQAHMYLIMGSAVAVGAVSFAIVKRYHLKAVDGKEPTFKPKKFQKGTIIGGVIFGAGWAITGACPGPIYAQIGKGDWMAFSSLAGALCGVYLYAVLRPRLPH